MNHNYKLFRKRKDENTQESVFRKFIYSIYGFGTTNLFCFWNLINSLLMTNCQKLEEMLSLLN